MYNIVLVGCGAMAKTWLTYALQRPDCQIVAMVDINLVQAQKMRQEYGLECAIYTQLEPAILENQANLVLDISIPQAHENVVLTATRLGCAVFGEKPLAHSLEAARRMVDAAAQHQRLYAVMQNRRYNRQALAFRGLLGQLGSIGALHADFFLAPHFGGFRELMQSPLLLDMAIHTFDKARFFLNADAVAVYCHEYNPKGSWFAGMAAAVCIFEMSDGSVFSYNGSWCAEGMPTSWEGQWRATGEIGSALWDGTNPPTAEVIANPLETSFTRSFRQLEPIMPEIVEGHAGCLDEMFAALKSNTQPQTVCSDNIKSLEMVFAALESAKRQKRIELSSL